MVRDLDLESIPSSRPLVMARITSTPNVLRDVFAQGYTSTMHIVAGASQHGLRINTSPDALQPAPGAEQPKVLPTPTLVKSAPPSDVIGVGQQFVYISAAEPAAVGSSSSNDSAKQGATARASTTSSTATSQSLASSTTSLSSLPAKLTASVGRGAFRSTSSTSSGSHSGPPPTPGVQVSDVVCMPSAAEAPMEMLDMWAFDVWEWARRVDGPLRSMVLLLAVRYDVVDSCNLPASQLVNFMRDIEGGYMPAALMPYHNVLHAADTVQVVNYLIVHGGLESKLGSLEILALLIGAAIHDFQHPGVNNNFLVATSDALALRYNDKSVQKKARCVCVHHAEEQCLPHTHSCL